MQKHRENEINKGQQKQREAEHLYNTYKIEEFRMLREAQKPQINPAALITRLSNSSKPLPDIK